MVPESRSCGFPDDERSNVTENHFRSFFAFGAFGKDERIMLIRAREVISERLGLVLQELDDVADVRTLQVGANRARFRSARYDVVRGSDDPRPLQRTDVSVMQFGGLFALMLVPARGHRVQIHVETEAVGYGNPAFRERGAQFVFAELRETLPSLENGREWTQMPHAPVFEQGVRDRTAERISEKREGVPRKKFREQRFEFLV